MPKLLLSNSILCLSSALSLLSFHLLRSCRQRRVSGGGDGNADTGSGGRESYGSENGGSPTGGSRGRRSHSSMSLMVVAMILLVAAAAVVARAYLVAEALSYNSRQKRRWSRGLIWSLKVSVTATGLCFCKATVYLCFGVKEDATTRQQLYTSPIWSKRRCRAQQRIK